VSAIQNDQLRVWNKHRGTTGKELGNCDIIGAMEDERWHQQIWQKIRDFANISAGLPQRRTFMNFQGPAIPENG